jgi:RNA polymerase-binding transcription factor DksA
MPHPTDPAPDPATDPARRRAQLLARLRDLDTRLHGIEAELLDHNDPDWPDRATEREQDEVLTALGHEGQHEIRAILAALRRLDAGEYGVCTQCGARIAPARLDLLPWTPFCASCTR